ncbi:MAG: hypothetical protein ACRDVD_04735 [Acidimicrobiia bacterium]
MIARLAAATAVTALAVISGFALGLVPRPVLLVASAGVVAARVAGWLRHRCLQPVPFHVGAVTRGLLALLSEVVKAGRLIVVRVIPPPAGLVALVGALVVSSASKAIGWIATPKPAAGR